MRGKNNKLTVLKTSVNIHVFSIYTSSSEIECLLPIYCGLCQLQTMVSLKIFPTRYVEYMGQDNRDTTKTNSNTGDVIPLLFFFFFGGAEVYLYNSPH